ncbi:MAG: sulfite reductase subunit beta (hemoprotein) [Bacillota bacterium]|nr:sulfite reductase subunit beta (hemoprotein) [Bacillota bacterium]
MELTNDQKKSLLGQGFIPSDDGVHFACRVLIPAGKMNAVEARKITEVCENYGKGVFNLTQRANVEIPWIKHQDLDKVASELKEVGLFIGGTGIRVRPALVCKGSVCKYGFINTEDVAKEIDERFYRGQYKLLLPNKFRIAISGCTNGCTKPQLGCIGLQGRKPNQVAIMIGGMFGKDHTLGRELPGLYSVSQALDIIEKAITYYRENGLQGERFAKTVERIGFETVKSFLVD